MFDSKKNTEPKPGEYETVVGNSILIEGDFSGKGNIWVQGAINGSINTENDIFIDQEAKINANITANNAKIAGEVNGNLFVKSRVDLLSTGKITGDIEADTINIEAGAYFNGKSTMKKETNHDNKKNNTKEKKAKSDDALL